jgi:predicted small metal-binding protein
MSHEFDCGEEGCSFRVRADEEDEVIVHARRHAEKVHEQRMSRAQVRESVSRA